MRIGFLTALNVRSFFPHIYPADIADDNHGKDDTDNSQRIGTGIPHCNFRTRIIQLRQSLVGRTKSRSIGHSSAKHTDHHRNFHTPLQGIIHNQCYRNVQCNNSDSNQIHRDTSLLERREERRPHLQTDTEHKENQSEVLNE